MGTYECLPVWGFLFNLQKMAPSLHSKQGSFVPGSKLAWFPYSNLAGDGHQPNNRGYIPIIREFLFFRWDEFILIIGALDPGTFDTFGFQEWLYAKILPTKQQTTCFWSKESAATGTWVGQTVQRVLGPRGFV